VKSTKKLNICFFLVEQPWFDVALMCIGGKLFNSTKNKMLHFDPFWHGSYSHKVQFRKKVMSTKNYTYVFFWSNNLGSM